MCDQKTLWDLSSATSSLASVDGVTRLDSQGGQMTDQCGREAARASPFQSLESGSQLPIIGISGPRSGDLSASEALQLSLENRLQALTDVDGSPEFVLTWKTEIMPLGLPICALRGRLRPISDNAIISWPTPIANDATGSTHCYGRKRADGSRARHLKLPGMVALVLPWMTPTAPNGTGGTALCKWGGTRSREKLREAVGNTALNGALNPAFPSWLMGYPEGFTSAGVLAMQSFPR